MSFSIAGKTAIVTGAATGVGLAIARHFQERGANVVAADMDEARLNEALGADASDDTNLRIFAGDLCQKLAIANLLSTAIDAFERVDILVNANRAVAVTDPIAGDDDTMEAMLRQNLLANLKMSQSVARRMIAQAEREGAEGAPAGSIVTVSSIASQRTRAELLAYSVACAGLDQATRSLALALAPHRVRVNGVAFGSVMSGHLQSVLKEHPDWRAEIAAGTPLGRIAAATEVTEAVQYLASDASGFVTGQILTVDGGRTLLDPVAVPAH
ncbi:SDR family NAD(P)-dependent oxidoreductase [Ostreiculturibacter nitratireducens]|uniref:SDR family NAD(P)-dependent oxidoreductase n=1 Tax=Ostreiculturibacter nitratireducens TaxID=3075226 RepID=UPI0031B633AC